MIPSRKQIFFLRCDQLGAVDGEERIALADILVSGIGKDLADVTREPDLHRRLKALVHIDSASRPNLITQLFVFDCAGLDSDAVHLFLRQLHRHQRSFHLGRRRGRILARRPPSDPTRWVERLWERLPDE